MTHARYAVVMAGGSGTRFWPASRRHTPKQLLRIAPGSSESLIEATVRRLAPLCPREHLLIATGEHLMAATRAALPQLPPECFLGEPEARNTAPCIGWAAALIAARDPEAVVMVVPSDQHVTDEPAFQRALSRAVASAASGVITTIGVQPSRPETGYGYIELGPEVEGLTEVSLTDHEGAAAGVAEVSLGDHESAPRAAPVHRVARFVEKPDRSTAEGYLASGRYVWNAGMFIFRAGDMVAELRRHLPELSQGLERLAAARGSREEAAIAREVFAAAPSISIDYGVMERAERLHVVPAAFGWSDLGSWESSWELGARDSAGNVAPASAAFVDAERNLVCDLRSDAAAQKGSPRVVALVGVNDLCVVQTDDALLVIPRERAQDVRQVVELLKQRGRADLL
ncbi:MAG: NTP transferase domain-containing protein [Polyangiaceae bacterium]|nr:NTP transferase domain-containing protein [Polyangiaceae bacterium]MCW5788994.1 NTP transferase domain-containing protein [Polyangiaceae bacterium]